MGNGESVFNVQSCSWARRKCGAEWWCWLQSSVNILGGSDSKEPACNAGDPGSIPGSRRSPRKGIGNPLQYSCLENPMDGGAWRATVHGVAESDTTEQLHLVSQNCTLYKSNFYVICFQPKLKKTKNLLSLAKGKCKGQCSKTENAQALVVLLGPTAQLTPRPARTPSSMESARPPSRGWSKASAHLPGWSQRRPHVSQDPHPCCLARVPPTETTREQKHGP